MFNARCWMRVTLDLELDLAQQDCREALDDNPHSGRFHGSMGWLHLRRGDDTKALGEFDKAIANQPEPAWPLYGRGLVRRHRGDRIAAEADLAQARKLMPEIDDRARERRMAIE